jgi:hypothetical protein
MIMPSLHMRLSRLSPLNLTAILSPRVLIRSMTHINSPSDSVPMAIIISSVPARLTTRWTSYTSPFWAYSEKHSNKACFQGPLLDSMDYSILSHPDFLERYLELFRRLSKRSGPTSETSSTRVSRRKLVLSSNRLLLLLLDSLRLRI